jgi:threonine dehydrogenase-like Zn-dependent dehydrogenase
MRAYVYRGPGKMGLEEKPIPRPGHGEAVIRVRLTTICGTDLAILRGEFGVSAGVVVGHEAVGEIHELGAGITGYSRGERVLVGAVTPCGQCGPCLDGNLSQCCGPLGGWRLGHTIDGTQAEYVRVPHAQANLAVIPDSVSDEDALLLSGIASTGFGAAEAGGVGIGDMVAVFAQGPIGLCATLGAKLRGAAQVFAVDIDPFRLKVASQFGATHTLLAENDAVPAIREFTGGRGVDVAIEALGIQETFENAIQTVRPGGTVSSIGMYSAHLRIPMATIGCGLNDVKIVTSLCPGGKQRMRRLLRMVESGRVNLKPLLTHFFTLDEIHKAYRLSASRRENVLKVAIRME